MSVQLRYLRAEDIPAELRPHYTLNARGEFEIDVDDAGALKAAYAQEKEQRRRGNARIRELEDEVQRLQNKITYLETR